MAWALQFDGVNDYASLASTWTATGDFLISGSFDRSNLTEIVLGLQSGTTNYLANLAGGTLRLRINGTTSNITGVTTSGRIDFFIARTGTAITWDFDGVTGGYNNATAFTLDSFGSYNSNSLNYSGKLYDTLTMNGDAGGDRFYDFTNSSHAAGTVVVSETTSSQDATGVNMPTDGSAWIDLGGGGISIAPNTVNSLSVSLNPVIVFNSVLSLNPLAVNSDSISLNPTLLFGGALELTPNTVNSNSSSLNPVIQFNASVGLSPSVVNSLSVALNPSIEYTSALIIAPQVVNSSSISLDPLIEFKSLIDLNPLTVDSLSIALSPIISYGQVQNIGTVTAGFADDKYSVKYKLSGITVNFKE